LTVLKNKDRGVNILKFSEMFGLAGPIKSISAFLEYDHCGYEFALEILIESNQS